MSKLHKFIWFHEKTEAIASQHVLCDAQICIWVLQEDISGALYNYYFTPTNYLQVVSGYNKYTRAHVVSLWLDFMLHAVVM